jgi:hypothetical protein
MARCTATLVLLIGSPGRHLVQGEECKAVREVVANGSKRTEALRADLECVIAADTPRARDGESTTKAIGELLDGADRLGAGAA